MIDDGILGSFDIVSIVGEICNIYEIEIPAGAIIESNFNSAKAMLDIIERLSEE